MKSRIRKQSISSQTGQAVYFESVQPPNKTKNWSACHLCSQTQISDLKFYKISTQICKAHGLNVPRSTTENELCGSDCPPCATDTT
ncbi:hypothetical protein Hanom_Chr09g00792381 [Helianthus anomalus]